MSIPALTPKELKRSEAVKAFTIDAHGRAVSLGLCGGHDKLAATCMGLFLVSMAELNHLIEIAREEAQEAEEIAWRDWNVRKLKMLEAIRDYRRHAPSLKE